MSVALIAGAPDPGLDPEFVQYLHDRRPQIEAERARLDDVIWRMENSREIDGWRSASEEGFQRCLDRLRQEIRRAQAQLEDGLLDIDRALGLA